MKRAIVVFAACVGCGTDWPDVTPAPPTGPPPGLGTQIAQSLAAINQAAIFQHDALQIFYEDYAVGWHAVEIDPNTLHVTTLPDPPLELDERVALGRVVPPVRAAFAVLRADGLETFVLDGPAWRALPPVPATDPTAIGQLLVHDGRTYLSYQRIINVFDGATWTQPLPTTPARLGGFDATTQWLVPDYGGSFAAIPLTAAGLGTEIAGPANAGPPAVSVINGDATAFQIATVIAVWRFDGATFTQTADLSDLSTVPSGYAGTPWSAPGGTRLLFSHGESESEQPWTMVENGVVSTALVAFPSLITCGCETCGCQKHAPVHFELDAATQGDRIAMTTTEIVDGYYTLFANLLAVPVTQSPFD